MVGKPSEVVVQDDGRTATKFSSPASHMRGRTWSFFFSGSFELGDQRLTLRLARDRADCKEAEMGDGKAAKASCADPAPPRLVIACARDELEVEVEGARRPVWRCQPDPPVPSGEWSGTPFPWIFGIDDPIDTLHAGEPEPQTSYQLRPAP